MTDREIIEDLLKRRNIPFEATTRRKGEVGAEKYLKYEVIVVHNDEVGHHREGDTFLEAWTGFQVVFAFETDGRLYDVHATE